MQAFVPAMIEQGEPAVVATTASRVGVTNPATGDPAYNASKAAVRAIAESLAHQLRNTPGCAVTSRLLLPGTTDTRFVYNNVKRNEGEACARSAPASETSMGAQAVPAEDVATLLLESVVNGGPFYVVAGDGDMSVEQFNVGVRWHAEDI